eukprot:scaffold52_cov183-Cylindrotheca_fusiformis.AAC.9
MKTISLTQLLSTCMDACEKGCKVGCPPVYHPLQTIRKFQENEVVEGKLKEEGDMRSVLTQADLDAQATIIGSLRETWGDDLRIIGEEDENDTTPNFDGTALKKNHFDYSDLFHDEKVPLDEITLFVDPLDGTREFVEGRLQNVASLIGIARDGKSIAGVVGLPFSEEPGHDIVIHYGIADQNASTLPKLELEEAVHEHDGITIFTGDSDNQILGNAVAHAMSMAKNPRHVIVGGTASKFQQLLKVPNSIAILHFKSQLWDTCASESIICSQGGKVTDMFGSPLVHLPNRPFGNIFGVIASSSGGEVSALHDRICGEMRCDTESVHKIFGRWMGSVQASTPQAVDVIRNLEGIPISTEEIEKSLCKDEKVGTKLKGYSVPETGAWRGLMSTGGRLILDWGGRRHNEGNLPSSVFYKRIVMADLAHSLDKLKNSPHKLVRDVRSYQVETSFLTSRACQEGLVKEAGLRINKVYGSDLRPVSADSSPKEQLQSKFSILLEDFNSADGWEQQWLLDEEAAMASLAEFAKMHAYFWAGSSFWSKEGGKLGMELENVVWENGGYMQPSLQGDEQFENVAKGFKERFSSFEAELKKVPELDGVDFSKIGERLEMIAREVGHLSHPFKGETKEHLRLFRTLIHGDPKQANIFFRRRAEVEGVDVSFIDFQWCGFGLAATDIAHHISAALLPACVSYDGKKEEVFLDHYHACLMKELVRFGVAGSAQEAEDRVFPRRELQSQYETALLDICRMVFAYAWRRWNAETEPTAASLNRNAYNKSLESALWLIARCHSLLDARGI